MVIMRVMEVMVNRRTHDHRRPHLETSLSGQEKKILMHCCWTAPFVFFYEWKRFPKDLWAHLQNECNVNCYWSVFFSPWHWIHSIITSILFEPVIGNKSCIHLQAPGITFKVTWLLIQEISTKTNECLESWKLHWRLSLTSTGPKRLFLCVFILWMFSYFVFCLCDVRYVFKSRWNKHRTSFVFLKSGVYDLLFTVWWHVWLKAAYSTTSMNVKSNFNLENIICLIVTEGLESTCFQF